MRHAGDTPFFRTPFRALREAAAILFAAWQGQSLWQIAGGRAFRIKDALKRLA